MEDIVFVECEIDGRKGFRGEASTGSHFDAVATAAIFHMVETACPVAFKFNGVDLVVSEGFCHLDQLRVAYREGLEEIHRKWAESPEGMAADREYEAECEAAIALHAECMARLPNEVRDQDALVDWLVEYSNVADLTYVAKDYPAVLAALKAAGYSGNAHVGRPKEDFEDPQVMAEYIVGQAISCMGSGMPPHPGLTEKFAEKYRAKRDSLGPRF